MFPLSSTSSFKVLFLKTINVIIHQSFNDFLLLQLASLEFLGFLQHFTVAVTSQWHWNVIKTSVYKLALKSEPKMSIQKRKNN